MNTLDTTTPTTSAPTSTVVVNADRRGSNITLAEVQDALERAWNSDDKTPEGFAAWRAYQGLHNDYLQQEMRKQPLVSSLFGQRA